MRAILRPLAAQTAHNPIETIVCGFILATLSYFHVLSAIKQSTFLSPSVPSPLRPAHAAFRDNEWISVSERDWQSSSPEGSNTLELQQLVFTLDSSKKSNSEVCLPLFLTCFRDICPIVFRTRATVLTPTQASSFSSSPLHSSLEKIEEYLKTSLSFSEKSYPSLCYGVPVNSTSTECFTSHSTGSRTSTLTLSFLPGAREDFISALKRQSLPDDQASGIRFVVETPRTTAEVLQRGRWMAYAVRALFMRFYDRASKADSLDILLVLAGYILMHTTFFRLLVSARALGSNFWLTAGILTSSTLAFVLAMPLALHLGIPVDPVLLTEALPFLVCTVGFDKPLRLGRAVFTHEHLFTPVTETSDQQRLHPNGRQRHTMKPAATLLLEALDREGNGILRDYALEIFVLTLGASSKVGGLRECCALAALILSVDCLMSVTFYIAVMGVMIEVCASLLLFLIRCRNSLFIESWLGAIVKARKRVYFRVHCGRILHNLFISRTFCGPLPGFELNGCRCMRSRTT